jgi:Subtilase family
VRSHGINHLTPLRPSDAPTFSAPRGRARCEYVPGQVIVRVNPDAVRDEPGQRLPEAVAEPLEYLLRETGASRIRALFADPRGRATALRKVVGSSVEGAPAELAGILVVEVDRERVPKRLIDRVAAARAIEFVEPMPARWLGAAPEPEPPAAPDPLRNRQWGLRAIRWFQAQIPDAAEVLVAIADTGVDESHPDLDGVVAEYHHVGLAATDAVGHGTHVSGIAAALTNNGIGITGVSNARVALWKIFADTPTNGDFYVDGTRYLRALDEIARSGARALNLSIGGTASSQTEQLLFDRLDAAGVTVAAAMGNEYDNGNPTEYPAAYTGVLAVGASAENDERAVFSNTGSHIGIVAPGVNILSTLPTRRSPYRPETEYASWSGTSMATPHVAAAAALVAAEHSDWTPSDVKAHLRETTAKVPAMGGRQRTNEYGDGLLDLETALAP